MIRIIFAMAMLRVHVSCPVIQLQPGPEDIFMIGQQTFCNKSVAQGMTREEWYRSMLDLQDEKLKKEILSCFGVSYEQTKKSISVMFSSPSPKRKLDETSMIGTWYVDKKSCCSQRSWGSVKSFNISLADIDFVKNSLKRLGFKGQLFFTQSCGITCAATWGNKIKIMPLFFFQAKTHRLHILHHELAHMYYADPAWKTFFNKLLVKSNISKANLNKAKKLVEKWNVFAERRAELLGFFNLKQELYFQDQIAKQNNFQGYPFSYKSYCSYVFDAKIDFIQDFLNGLKNDYRLQFTALKLAGAM